jgi:hypothetical protein
VQGEGILQTIAEISVAFTGFTGVVAVFGRRADQPWIPLELFRFRVLLGASLAALLFSLLPFIFHYAGVSNRLTWTAGSALITLHLAIVAAHDARTLVRIPRERHRAPLHGPELLVSAIALGVWLIQVLNVLSFFGDRSFAAYLVALIYYLFVAAVNFIRLLAPAGVA